MKTCYRCQKRIIDLLHEFPSSYYLKTGKEYTNHDEGTLLCSVSCLLKHIVDLHI